MNPRALVTALLMAGTLLAGCADLRAFVACKYDLFMPCPPHDEQSR